MSTTCEQLHRWFGALSRQRFPLDLSSLAPNGIYLLFEAGESAHGVDRIVRVGTHRGDRKLPARIKEHFLNENKDRSIFRKNVGRAILARNGDSFLDSWNLDLTSALARRTHGPGVNRARQAIVEKLVTGYVQSNCSLAVIEVRDRDERLQLEKCLISVVSLCKECSPSADWLGLLSPEETIRKSGLWQRQHVFKAPDQHVLHRLAKLLS